MCSLLYVNYTSIFKNLENGFKWVPKDEAKVSSLFLLALVLALAGGKGEEMPGWTIP